MATFLREVAKERAASIVTLTLVAELMRLISRARQAGHPHPPRGGHHRPRRDAPAGRRSGAPGAGRPRGHHRLQRPPARRRHLGRGGHRRRVPRRRACSSRRRSPSSARGSPSCPRPRDVEVPRPDEALRRSFVSARLAALGPGALGLSAGYTVEAMVADAKGLTLRDLDDLLTAAQRSPDQFRIDRAAVVAIVNRTLQERLGSIITVVYPSTRWPMSSASAPSSSGSTGCAGASTIPSVRPRASPSSDPTGPARRSSSRRSPARPTGRSSRSARSAASGTARPTSSPRPSQPASRPSAASSSWSTKRTSPSARCTIARRTRPRRDWPVT